MQEIILAVDLVETNLVRADSTQLTYEEKVEMLEEVRSICLDVSGNLPEKILAEAPKFSRNIANERREDIDLKVVKEATDRVKKLKRGNKGSQRSIISS